MKIRDAMTPDIEIVTPDDTLKTAARLMADLDVGALPVGGNNRLIGMITARDIAIHVGADGSDPEATPVCQAMTSDLLYCFENESADDVAQKMAEWWVRRLPVVDHDKRLVGLVSLADLVATKATSGLAGVQTRSHRFRAGRSPRQTRRPRKMAAAA